MKVGLEKTDAHGIPDLEIVPADRPITIMDLLRHTSEISYDYIGGPWVMKAYKAAHLFEGHFDNKEFAERIARLPLARQPGTLWRYGHSTDACSVATSRSSPARRSISSRSDAFSIPPGCPTRNSCSTTMSAH